MQLAMIWGIKINLMEVMGGRFVGMDPPDEWADLLVVCCGYGV